MFTAELQYFPSEDKGEIDKIDGWRKLAVEGSRSEIPFAVSANTWDRVRADSEACSHIDALTFKNAIFSKRAAKLKMPTF